MTEDRKICRQCREPKPLGEFTMIGVLMRPFCDPCRANPKKRANPRVRFRASRAKRTGTWS